MSTEAVDVIIKNQNVLGDPLEGVVVKVLSEDGLLVFGQSVTDADGRASLLLPEATYQLRFYKFAVNFNPMCIAVVQGETNSFNVYGTAQVQPQATDPRLCVASGFFRSASGAPQKNLDIHFLAKFDPVLLDGSAVLSERVAIRTDARGYAEVTLIRNAQYDVTLQGMENIYRSVNVPDAAAINLPDLLFPGIKGIAHDALSPLVLTVGEEVDVAALLVTTDLRELEELGGDVTWSLSNPSVISIELLSGLLKIRALQPGSCTISGTRSDNTIVRIPNTPLEGLPIQVTVTA